MVQHTESVIHGGAERNGEGLFLLHEAKDNSSHWEKQERAAACVGTGK